MNLTQPERIQILRKRKGLNQGALGKQAFNTSFESGRTKIKNIELGKQIPGEADIRKIARVLDVAPGDLISTGNAPARMERSSDIDVCLSEAVLARFPGLGDYLDMLNKAAVLEDGELIQHISEKIAELMSAVRTAADDAPGRSRSA